MATCIGCVTRDQNVPGSPHVQFASVWTYTCAKQMIKRINDFLCMSNIEASHNLT